LKAAGKCLSGASWLSQEPSDGFAKLDQFGRATKGMASENEINTSAPNITKTSIGLMSDPPSTVT
jgi:hypothetical protein